MKKFLLFFCLPIALCGCDRIQLLLMPRNFSPLENQDFKFRLDTDWIDGNLYYNFTVAPKTEKINWNYNCDAFLKGSDDIILYSFKITDNDKPIWNINKEGKITAYKYAGKAPCSLKVYNKILSWEIRHLY